MAVSVEDRLAIMETVSAYSAAAGRLDGRAMERVLMPDAVLGGVSKLTGGEDKDIVGARAIGDLFAGAFAHMEFIHQVPHVAELKVDGDRAEATTMVIEYLREKATGDLALLCANYEDKLIRTADGWKFTRRDFRVKSFSKLAEKK